MSESRLFADQVIRSQESCGRAAGLQSIHRCAIVTAELKKTPFNTAPGGLAVCEEESDVMDLKKRLHNTLEALILQDFRHFLTSATQGIELWAAEELIKLREQYHDVILEIVIPYDKHSGKWQQQYQERYRILCEQADIVTTLSHSYNKGAIFARNRYLMAFCSTMLFAYTEGTATERLAQQARWAGKQAIRLPLVRRAA